MKDLIGLKYDGLKYDGKHTCHIWITLCTLSYDKTRRHWLIKASKHPYIFTCPLYKALFGATNVCSASLSCQQSHPISTNRNVYDTLYFISKESLVIFWCINIWLTATIIIGYNRTWCVTHYFASKAVDIYYIRMIQHSLLSSVIRHSNT